MCFKRNATNWELSLIFPCGVRVLCQKHNMKKYVQSPQLVHFTSAPSHTHTPYADMQLAISVGCGLIARRVWNTHTHTNRIQMFWAAAGKFVRIPQMLICFVSVCLCCMWVCAKCQLPNNNVIYHVCESVFSTDPRTCLQTCSSQTNGLLSNTKSVKAQQQ